jgi:hypothetical protein
MDRLGLATVRKDQRNADKRKGRSGVLERWSYG